MSKDTVYKYLDILEECGVIERQHKRKSGQFRNTVYILCDENRKSPYTVITDTESTVYDKKSSPCPKISDSPCPTDQDTNNNIYKNNKKNNNNSAPAPQDAEPADSEEWKAPEVKPEPPKKQISLEDAKEIDSKFELGDIVHIPIESKSFGRIATQNAKNLILQKIREEERKVVYDQYFEKEKDIVTGIVQRYVGKNVSINLGKADAMLTENEQVKGEVFKPTERIKLYVVEVKNTTKGPKILVSRTHPELVKRLFESEVTEVKDGTVEIKSIAREAGSRTKIAVWSNDPDVDPVGACVGMNGARVNAIVNELRGEKIDIINWSDNPAILIENALSPAKVISVMADPDEKTASVIVPDYQLSLAIGKEGQNARLAARLTGYKIDIKNETQAIETGELPENYMELSEGVYEEEYDDDAEEFDVENTADAEYDEDDAEITFDEVEDTEE